MNFISYSAAKNKGVEKTTGAEKPRNLQDALFAHGIVIVATGAGEWGFAVRR